MCIENPLLQPYNTPLAVPPFDAIEAHHYLPAFQAAMRLENERIAALLECREDPTVGTFLLPLVRAGEELSRVASVFYNVEAAETNDHLQAIAEEVAPLLSGHSDAIRQNQAIYQRLQAIKRDGLSADEERLLEQTQLRFLRAGVELAEEEAERVRSINQELALLQLRFGRNVLEETNAGKLVVEREEDLFGLPEGVVASAAQAARERGLEGKWLFTPHKASLLPFLTYSASPELRAKLYALYYRRGDQGNAHDNNAVVLRMLQLRRERAELLGYPSHAHYALEQSMAEGPERVSSFLGDMVPAAIRTAQKELELLRGLAHGDGLEAIAPSDWWYYAERVRSSKYALEEEALRPYLSLDAARKGIFTLAKELYGLQFTLRRDLPVYHPEVEAYEVFEADGTHLAVLYLDYHPRAGKGAGAWCTTYQPYRVEENGEVRHPVVSIVCNFTRPVGDAPALLTFDEVETLFHEFGHALHGFFTRCPWPGMGGVPRDFVELPSQVLEHWAGEPAFLRQYAKHYKTGEPMPEDLIDRLQASRRFNQGFNLSEYLAAAILDQEYHAAPQPIDDLHAHEDSTLRRFGFLPEILPRYRATYYSHLFDGGYSAAYYSYLWSEVLDCDAYEAFRERGLLFDPDVAARFRQEVLRWGGSRDARTLWLAFRGREPEKRYLLHHRLGE